MQNQSIIKKNRYIIRMAICCIGCAGFVKQAEPVSKKITRAQYTMVTAIDSVPVRLIKTLPAAGKLLNEKPAGKGWVNLLASAGNWNADQRYWRFRDGGLHGEYDGGAFHNYAWTKKAYADYELNVLIRMQGREANSGVCIRIHPVDADNVPGYQVDMGPGYWGCLWEEKRAGMVQAFPKELADQLVKDKDWNHYYVIAKGHHIQAWLNDVKTIDTTHIAGFEDGFIGFQLCHGDKHTIIDVKALYIREIK
jgi:hypothetical protein